ncbi:MAG TPA: AraC family transcriptional regulator [Opitutaceae bacterium]|nr:AraC family transcriptional regulator [Opitutaceae bacterium]
MNRGRRDFNSTHRSIPRLPRGNWEFYAVVDGSLRPYITEKPSGPFYTNRLWVFPPDSPHGWSNPVRQPCEIMVFHFATVHPLLERAMTTKAGMSVPLKPTDIEVLERLYAQLYPHYEAPQRSSVLYFEETMIQLCKIMVEHNNAVASAFPFDHGAEKIIQAVEWHRQHLAEGASVNEVAAAIHISTGHLRRLFLSEYKESPKRFFLRVALKQSRHLMAETTMSYKEIAGACGFCSFSAFYRAFKRHFDRTPSAWRNNKMYAGIGLKTTRDR